MALSASLARSGYLVLSQRMDRSSKQGALFHDGSLVTYGAHAYVARSALLVLSYGLTRSLSLVLCSPRFRLWLVHSRWCTQALRLMSPGNDLGGVRGSAVTRGRCDYSPRSLPRPSIQRPPV